MRLGVCAVAIAFCFIGTANARADSVFFSSDSYYEGLESGAWRTPDDAVVAQGDTDHIGVTAGSGADQYHFTVAAPYGDTLGAGRVYDHAEGSRDATHSTLAVGGPGGGACEGGRFEILDVAFGQNDTITRLHLLFQCRRDRPSGFGEISIGEGGQTTPAVVRWPTTDAGVAETPATVSYTAPNAITVSGVALTGADASAFGLSDNGCTGTHLASGAACTVKVSYPAAAAGTRSAAVRFTLSDGTHADTALQGLAFGGTTRVTLDSDPGEPVTNGSDFTFAPSELTFDLDDPDSVFGAVIHRGDFGAVVRFYAPTGNVLEQPQSFAASRFSVDDPGARLGIAATGSCQSALTNSSLTIDATRHWPTGDLRSFAGHFVQHCGGQTAALRGTLQFRDGDTTPLPPWVDERPSDPAPAANSVSFYSDPDDLVGQHVVKTWAGPTDAITVDKRGDGVLVRAAGGQYGGGLDLLVRPPTGAKLVPGVYTHALGADQGDATHGELQAGIGEFIGGTDGRFEVLDFAENADGSVKRLWLVYEDAPQLGYGSYFGEVRYGEPGLSLTPGRLRFPETDVGRPSRYAPVLFVAPQAMHVDAASVTGNDAAQFRTGADECTGRTLVAGERCRVWVRYDATAAGVARGALRLTSGSSSWTTALDGFSWGGTTKVTVANDPNVNQPFSYTFTPANARISAGSSAAGVGVSLLSTTGDEWDLVAGPAAGTPLVAPASFDNARWWFSSGPGPRLAVYRYRNSSGCTLVNSSFSVDELRRWPDGSTRATQGQFVQHCDDGGLLQGTFAVRAGDQTQPAPWMIPGAAASPTPNPEATTSPTASPSPTISADDPVTSAPPFTPPSSSTPPGTTTTSPVTAAKHGCAAKRTAAARHRCRLVARRHTALKRCRAKHGARRTRCVRRARSIGRGHRLPAGSAPFALSSHEG